jgi:hypothetical protein
MMRRCVWHCVGLHGNAVHQPLERLCTKSVYVSHAVRTLGFPTSIVMPIFHVSARSLMGSCFMADVGAGLNCS